MPGDCAANLVTVGKWPAVRLTHSARSIAAAIGRWSDVVGGDCDGAGVHGLGSVALEVNAA